jgi:hypothetical protein
MPGAVFLICVATQGIAMLAATLATAWPASWLARVAAVCFVIGLVLYLAALAHFDFENIRSGAGDHWIACGAPATSALAAATLVAAPGWGNGLHDVLRVSAFVLLAVAVLSYCVLAAAEVRWPRPRYDARRWATVYSLGVTAVATLTVAIACDASWLTAPGRVLLWIATAVWLLTFANAFARIRG